MSIESDCASIVNDIIKLTSTKNSPETLLFGTVTGLEPLRIKINSNGLELYENQLFLGQMCRPHKVTIPHTHQYNGQTEKATATKDGDLQITTVGQAATTVIEVQGHSHNIKEQVTEDVHKKDTDFETSVTLEIYPKLKVNDTVLMFAFNNYQKYYVAERIESAEE